MTAESFPNSSVVLNETRQALFTCVGVHKPPRITAIHPA
jgi:hypothetical protein